MNVFDAEGRGLIADLSLPDIPIGRGDDLIYVVDSGPAGRGADGIDSIRLLGVSVEESLREYGVDTGREQPVNRRVVPPSLRTIQDARTRPWESAAGRPDLRRPSAPLLRSR